MPSVDVGRVGFVAPVAGALTLRALLRAQPDASLLRLASRRGLELDPHKQLDTAEQVARGLAMLPRGIVEALGAAAGSMARAAPPGS